MSSSTTKSLISIAVAAVPGIGAMDEWVAGVGRMREDGQCGCHCFCSADVFPQSPSSAAPANAPASSVQATTLVTATQSNAAIPSQGTTKPASEISAIVVSPLTEGPASSSSVADVSAISSSSTTSGPVSSETKLGTEQASQSAVVAEITTSETPLAVASEVSVSTSSTTVETLISTTTESGAELTTTLTDSQAPTSAGEESAAAPTATDSDAPVSAESESTTSTTTASEEASDVASGSSIAIAVAITPPPLAISQIADADLRTKEIADLSGLDLRSSIVAGSFSLPQFS